MKEVDKKNIQDILALTPMQEGMLFHYLEDQKSHQYFEQLSISILAQIDPVIFEAAWNIVVQSNEMLRTVFRWEKVEHPLQIILKEYAIKPIYVDIPGKTVSEKQKLLNAIKVKDRETKFDLQHVPFRITLCKLHPKQYQLIVSNHHILYDGWSNGIILREFFNAYNALSNGKKSIKPIKTKFKEFVKWTREQDTEKQGEYWSDYLRGIDTGTRLPIKTGKARGLESLQNDESISHDTTLPGPMTRNLEEVVKEYKVTIASLLYSAWGMLLQKYTGSDDVLFGTTISGRSAKIKGIEDMVGMFINTLPLRAQTHAAETTIQLIKRTNEILEDRQAYEHTPLANIRGYSQLEPREELFDSVVVIENYPLDSRLFQENGKLKVTSVSTFEMTNYDLTVGIFLSKKIEVRFHYNRELFEEVIIEKLARHFINILKDIAVNPGKKIHEIDMLSQEEKKQILVDFNDTGANFPGNKTIHSLFAEQVEKTPDHLAAAEPVQVKYRTHMTYMTYISYRELNRKSDQMAHLLIGKGVKPGTIAAVMMEPSFEMIIGLLGILKAGGAYLPIDPEYPEERVQYMLADSGTKILLATEDIEGTSFHPSTLLPFYPSSPSSLAYIIYTSGSTGIPKGVAVSHRGAVNTLCCRKAVYRMNPAVTSLQLFSSGFDGFVTSFFTPIISGAKVILLTPAQVRDIDTVKAAIILHRVTHFISVPSLFQAILEQLTDEESSRLKLEVVTLAGEKLLPHILEKAKQKTNNIEIVNEYGVTEAAVMSTISRHQEQSDVITIGHPTWNTSIYILDRHYCLQPLGVPGELCIAGTGVARGYLNNPELTTQKFDHNQKFLQGVQGAPWHGGPIRDGSIAEDVFDSSNCTCNLHLPPWAKKRPPGRRRQKLYHTGDLARWLPGGAIEYLGRIDFQVKIRGYRIEPGEIENQLLTHPNIKDALVTARQYKNGEKYLCAYVVAASSPPSLPRVQSLSHSLGEYLAGRLPDYMIPAYFVLLEKMPLNSNGKIDTKALPAPGLEKSGVIYTAPRDDVEKQLVKIWSKVLEVDHSSIGIDDNFFRLGGHSLKATTVVQHIYKEFEVNIEIKSMFTYPFIRGLAKRLRELAGMSYEIMTAVEEKEYYPMSFAQRRLWVLCQFEEDSTAYNIPTAFTITGPFHADVFTRAVQALVDRHESLRTIFISVDGVPVQEILKNFKFNLEQIDLRSLDKNTKEEKTRAIYLEDANRAFDLEHGPLFRFKLIQWEDEKYVLIHNMHHIVNDGWSQGIISNGITTLYNAFLEGGENPLPPLQLQYKDYTLWHNRSIETGGFNLSTGYWLEKFKDKPNGIELPLDHPRKAVQTFNGGRVTFPIGREKTAGLAKICSEADATLFMGLLTLVTIFLYRYSGQPDIVIGSPIANRRRTELHPIIGFFVNTLVYRTRLRPGNSFRELLKVIKDETLACYEYQDYPFDLLVEQLEPDRDLSQSPLFNVMLAHNNAETQDLNLVMKDINISGYAHSDEFNMSKFDLIFFMDEVHDQVYTRIEYNSDLFEHSTIQRMRDNFLALAEDVIAREDNSISSLNILSEAELARVVQKFNDTAVSFETGELTLQELFERQVEKSADKTAVTGMAYSPQPAAPNRYRSEASNTLTYKKLNQKVNQLAHFLREEYGVKPNHVIGLSMERSLDMMAALLGIVKAGAAYLAVDPTYPGERVLHVLADSQVRLLITDAMRPHLYENYKGTIIDILSQSCRTSRGQAENPEVKNQPADILYVNYTSGSTGTPNGAMLSHDILRNLIQWQTEKTSIDCSLKCLQFTSINFCVSFQEIMGTLTAGGALFLIGDIERQDIDYLMDFLSRHQIENLFLPFSYLNFLFNESSRWNRSFKHHLKHIITAGEQLKITTGLQRFLDLNPHLKLHNHYGSTEMHVVTSYTLDAASAGKTPIPPAGKPISNVKIYILDEHLEPVPVGVWGELFVSGISEVLGYINNDELTNRKLVNHPIFSKGSYRLYRSGDIGRWLADGNIELRGRKDSQVKIRGFRIEPGEIESKILAIKGVRECVVVVKKDEASQQYLAAYVVLEGIDVPAIKQRISSELPQYMLPKFVVLDSLPLMPNGKVDREKLPDPGLKLAEEYTPPADQVEEKLVNIWSELLGVPTQSIGVEFNFFQLGGHSLKATLMMARIHKVFNVKIPLIDIFTSPYIRGLAQKIKEMVTEQFTGIAPVEKKDYHGLSSAQERLYILQQMDLESTVYNMPTVVKLEGVVDNRRIEEAFDRLIARHESLRTSFAMVHREPAQVVHHKVEFEIEYGQSLVNGHWSLVNCQGRGEVPSPVQVEKMIRGFIRPFDLSRAPLLRVSLITLRHTPSALRGHRHFSQEGKKNKYLLMLDMHHIISDGMSMDILVREFNSFYVDEGERLHRLKTQYKDFSRWQNQEKQRESLQQQAAYWRKQFADQVPVLNLPTDYMRPALQSFAGSALYFEISKENTKILKKVALEQGATLFMVLLSMYAVFLSKLSSQEDIIIGTPVAGRPHAELESIIGMFVNTLALRNFPRGEHTFNHFLYHIKEQTLEAFANQDYPYETLVETIAIDRDASRNPLFDTMFALQNMDIGKIEIPGLKITRNNNENIMQIAKFDMTLMAVESEGDLVFTLEYCTKLFTKETMQRFIRCFNNLVANILVNPKEKIADLEIISDQEKQQVLYDFNDTIADYPNHKTIHQLFAEQVEQTPDHIALAAPHPLENRTHRTYMTYISYKELNQKSHQLTQWLTEKGVGYDTIVAIMGERSLETITGILAILKAGGAYLPIDPEYPQERIDFMLKDSDAKLLLTHKEIADAGSSSSTLTSTSTCQVSPANLAYIIYTSGSTGRPKGVMITHKNVTRLVKNTNYVELTPKTRILQTGALVFDASTFEIWGSLLNSGQLVLTDKEIILNAFKMAAALAAHQVNTLWLSAPLFNQIEQQNPALFSPLSYLLVGGDVLSPTHINRVKEKFPHLEIINGYGPTENTTFSTTYLIEKTFQRNIPIGRPINNSTAYIIDQYGHLVPVGVTGELIVGGHGVGRGYLNNPELTAERFCLWRPGGALFVKTAPPGPPCKNFSLMGTGKNYMHQPGVLLSSKLYPRPYALGPRLYHTGDLARWLADGNIEFLGRLDYQVKIRGFRVEPGEIERQLSTHETVKEAVVTINDHKETGDKYLCAYFVPVQGAETAPDQAELKRYLANVMPDYMIPLFFIALEKIPLNANGKLDRKALPDAVSRERKSYIAPNTDTEKKLAGIWQEVLGPSGDALPASPGIGIHDDFFELGGHSLKALQVAGKIHKTFGVEIRIQELFLYPTIAELAGFIHQQQASDFSFIEPQPQQPYYELSYTQERLWLIYRQNPHSGAFNMPAKMTLHENVDASMVRLVLEKLMTRHESLRTSFKEIGKKPVQVIAPIGGAGPGTAEDTGDTAGLDLDFETIDLSGVDEVERQNQRDQLFMEETAHIFDLKVPPLFRTKLIKCRDREFDLIFNAHHIISDGWSMEILKQEFNRFYEGYKQGKPYDPEPPRIGYKDYAAWHNRLLADEEKAAKAKESWKNYLSGTLPVLDLPYDFSPVYGTPGSKKSSAYCLVIESAAAEGLRLFARERQGSLFMVLLASFNILLSHITGQEEILLAVPAAARQHQDLENIVGMFVNTLILRNRIKMEQTFSDLFQAVQTNTFQVLEYQAYPLELIFGDLKMRYPEISVFFNMVNTGFSHQEYLTGLDSYHIPRVQDAKFDLVCYLAEYKNGIQVSCHYARELFLPETIEKIIRIFKKLLENIAQDPEKTVKEYFTLKKKKKIPLGVKKKSENS